MKTFAFTLEWLLRLKRQRERLAELLLARARAEVDAARARVADLRGQLDRLARGLDGTVGTAVAPGRWAAVSEQSVRLGGQLDDAERGVRQAEERQAEAARQRVRLAQEVEALQTLRAQQWEAYRRDVGRAEQQRLDELSLRRWQPPAAAPRAIGRRP